MPMSQIIYSLSQVLLLHNAAVKQTLVQTCQQKHTYIKDYGWQHIMLIQTAAMMQTMVKQLGKELMMR